MIKPKETKATEHELNAELLVLPDGRVLAHNLTPELAEVLKSVGFQAECCLDANTRPQDASASGETTTGASGIEFPPSSR